MLFFTKDNSIVSPRRGLFVFSGVFLLIMGVTVGGFYLWKGYFSEGARYARQVEANMEKYNEWEAGYTKAMTEDTYGGKTPEETLQMFIAALRKEDIDLASKYFMLNTVGKVDQKWIDGLAKTKEAGKLQEVADNLSLAIPATEEITHEGDFRLVVQEGDRLSIYIDLELNSLSNVWKIESL